jgi:hypothetical protein
MANFYTLEQVARSFGDNWRLKSSTGLLHTPQDIDLSCKVEMLDGTIYSCHCLRILESYWDDVTRKRVAVCELTPYSLDENGVRVVEFHLGHDEVCVFDLNC